jgi:replicative DNA helicase
MHKLCQIELIESGIIVFGARNGNGLTLLTLKLANQLAKTKQVLFICYTLYKEQITNYLKLQGETLSPHLTIDTKLEFYHSCLAHEISELVSRTSPDTIIIDNLNDMFGNSPNLKSDYKNQFLDELKVLTQENKLQVILKVTAMDSKEGYHWDRPSIQHFNWSRQLVDDADQIFSFHRPAYYDIPVDVNGDSTMGKTEVHLIKSRDGKKAYYEIYNYNEVIDPYRNTYPPLIE